MAIFKYLKCKECGHRTTANQEKRPVPRCTKCGDKAYYSEKWYGRRGGVVKALSSNKSDAIIQHGVMCEDVSVGVSDKGVATIKKLGQEFISWAEGETEISQMAPGSFTSYKMRVEKHIIPTWGHMTLRAFCAKAEYYVDAYRRERIKEVTPATVNREISTLKRMLSWAKSRRLIRHNPLEGYAKLYEDNKQSRVLSDDEIVRLREACRGKGYERVRMIVEIGLSTGLRIEGALTLKWSEIDFSKKVITKVVKHHRKHGPKTVTIPMTQRLIDALKEHRLATKVANLNGYVCPSPRNPGQPMRITSDWGFRAALKRAKIKDCSFHTLRHSFASRFLIATGDIHTLANLLGHSSTYITERYAHMLEEHRNKVMDTFSKYEESNG